MSSLVGSASVDFPSMGSDHAPVTYLLPRHLPFRRISLPSTPSALHRQSIASMASFDSFPEEAGGSHVMISSVSKSRRSKKISTSAISRKKLADDPRDAKRRRVIHEFYETERSYVDGLELIYSHFLTPIIESLDTRHPLLDRTELTSVFSNFIDIWNLHRSFFLSLSTHLQTLSSTNADEAPPPLSPILSAHFPYLSLYNPFISSFDTALSSYETLLSTKQDFASFVRCQEADPKCGKLKLRDWFLTIVQRCPRYLLLLKDLIGCTDPEDPEHAQLVSVHALVSKITLSLNGSLQTHAETLSLLAIQRNTPNLPFQLISPGRSLLKRGTLLLVDGSTPREREFFLFSDYIMWLSGGELLSDRWPVSGSPSRSSILQARAKSDVDLSEPKERRNSSPLHFRSKPNLQPSYIKKQRLPSSGGEERWQYRGHISLVDIEVVVSPSLESGEHYQLEILSPQMSFAIYAASEEERNEWAEAVRNAKESLFESLNAINQNSTLTSSSSTNHLRRTLQALPHLPEEVDIKPKRGKVEHFVPAIWVPDNKMSNCMRCGRSFGWRRRRHHCRLCGRCVCSNCSGKTFFISGSNDKGEKIHKPARACDACYETVFPIVDPTAESSNSNTHYSGVPTLSFPSWKSVHGSAFSTSESTIPAAPSFLMAIDLESPKRELTRIEDQGDDEGPNGCLYKGPPKMSVEDTSRPRSYYQILEDFRANQPEESHHSNNMDNIFGMEIAGSPTSLDLVDSSEEIDSPSSAGLPRRQVREAIPSPLSSFSGASPSRRKEDTVRRRKRFSMPALGLQTTPVTARPNVIGEGKSRRTSLILGYKGPSSGAFSNQGQLEGSELTAGVYDENKGYGQGVVGKLNELLEKTRGRR